MSVKFFGQYLIESGEIDASQLREALALMRKQNRTLGEITIQQAFLSRAQATLVNRRQRTDDHPFGELALALGLLTRDELDNVLAIQKETHLLLGEALVQLGHVAERLLEPLLADFKADQAPYTGAGTPLPDALGDDGLAPIVVDLLPRLCLRIAGLHAKMAPGFPLDRCPPFPFRASVVARTQQGLSISLLGDRRFAGAVAGGTREVDVEARRDAFIQDGLGEFMNIVVGSAVSVYESRGHRTRIEPPVLGVLPTTGWGFDVAVTKGRAYLVLGAASRTPRLRCSGSCA